MAFTAELNLNVVDGRAKPWQEAARPLLNERLNFLLIIPNTTVGMSDLEEFLGVEAEDFPPTLDKEQLNQMSRFIDPDDMGTMSLAELVGHKVYFVQQLHLPKIRPPETGDYLLYCAIRGVISDHPNFKEARHACSTYVNDLSRRGVFPEASIYHWRGMSWWPLRTC